MAYQYYDIGKLDPFIYTGPTRAKAATAVRTLTPTQDVDYGEYMSLLYVGVTGNVSYVKWDGTSQTLNNVAAGIWHRIGTRQINSSGTTATGIVVGS